MAIPKPPSGIPRLPEEPLLPPPVDALPLEPPPVEPPAVDVPVAVALLLEPLLPPVLPPDGGWHRLSLPQTSGVGQGRDGQVAWRQPAKRRQRIAPAFTT